MKIPRIPFRFTILGRSVILISTLVLTNVAFWIVAAILFKPHDSGDASGILSLAMLAWTIGLRHALDADHISAIDNATRGLIQLGQLPITCGLFFSLGHSTIVVVFIIAIAVSSDIYDKVGGFGEKGGIIGASVSGSFLFIIGIVNSYILYQNIKDRRRSKHGDPEDANPRQHRHLTIVMRFLAPVVKIVDHPWKMYPVGLLFGLGFDTASSIALLAVSALAKRDAKGRGISSASIVILPLLFTAGMSLVDSLDSVLMLYSYAGFPEKGWALVRRRRRGGMKKHQEREDSLDERRLTSSASVNIEQARDETVLPPSPNSPSSPAEDMQKVQPPISPGVIDRERSGEDNPTLPNIPAGAHPTREDEEDDDVMEREKRAIWLKNNSMSTLSIVLTLISILLAFTISIITIMALIGEQCRPCREAAEAEEGQGGGLAGRWWRGWARAADASGYIGAGIVGGFVLVVGVWYLARYIIRRKANKGAGTTTTTTTRTRMTRSEENSE